jgi:CBS domain-containing protein
LNEHNGRQASCALRIRHQEVTMKVLDRVSMLLREKGNAIYSLPPDATVYSAIELMADKGVGALLIIDGDRLVGIISERDYARKIILQGKSSSDTFVREIMTPSPITIRCEDNVDEAMRRMTENRIRHLPVIDSAGHVAGMLSIGDLVKWIVTSQDETIEHLQHYIAGDLCH